MGAVNIRLHSEFSFLFLNLYKVLKNSTPGKVAYIWQIEFVQIDAVKFERMQINFLAMFSLPPLSLSLLLKLPNNVAPTTLHDLVMLRYSYTLRTGSSKGKFDHLWPKVVVQQNNELYSNLPVGFLFYIYLYVIHCFLLLSGPYQN